MREFTLYKMKIILYFFKRKDYYYHMQTSILKELKMENRVLRAHAGARYGRQSRIVAAMHCVRVSKYMHRECPQFFVDNVLHDLAVAGASYTRRNIIRDVLTRLTK